MISNAVKDQARRAAWRIAKGMDPDLPEMGQGHFSKVYSLGDGLVLKVGGPGGYGDGDCTPGKGTTFLDEVGRPMPDGWPAYVKWLEAEYGNDKPEWAPVVHHLEQMRGKFYFAICEELSSYDGDEDQHSPPSDLYITLESAAASIGWLRMDLHGANVMCREDTLVINDPWVPSTH